MRKLVRKNQNPSDEALLYDLQDPESKLDEVTVTPKDRENTLLLTYSRKKPRYSKETERVDRWFGKKKGYNFFNKLFRTLKYNVRRDFYNSMYSGWTLPGYVKNDDGEIEEDLFGSFFGDKEKYKSIAELQGVTKNQQKYFLKKIIPVLNEGVKAYEYVNSYYGSKGYSNRNYGDWGVTGLVNLPKITYDPELKDSYHGSRIKINPNINPDKLSDKVEYYNNYYLSLPSTMAHELGHFWYDLHNDLEDDSLAQSILNFKNEYLSGKPYNRSYLNDEYIKGSAKDASLDYYRSLVDTFGGKSLEKDFPDYAWRFAKSGEYEENIKNGLPAGDEIEQDYRNLREEYANKVLEAQLPYEQLEGKLVDDLSNEFTNKVLAHDISDPETYADLTQLRYLLNKEKIYDSRKSRKGSIPEITEDLWTRFTNSDSYKYSRLALMYDYNTIKNMLTYFRKNGGVLETKAYKNKAR